MRRNRKLDRAIDARIDGDDTFPWRCWSENKTTEHCARTLKCLSCAAPRPVDTRTPEEFAASLLRVPA